MALDILELRKLCIPKNIRITLHAAKRLEQRRIFLKDVIACIMNGEIIEQYPDDYPYPSCLILGMSIEDKYLHVVIVTIFSNIDAVEQYFAFGRVIQTAKQRITSFLMVHLLSKWSDRYSFSPSLFIPRSSFTL